eukprot:TRINITY_DN6983_c0_g2_i1.p1 TRINITY_DN6983_c0_g2~~TRINITY_DN6983_c0_g2_i1.p1  ORF type:complete len:882 (-),score=188.36 TRINITY_DN6983_c0_g2_i1:1105-3750(-)
MNPLSTFESYFKSKGEYNCFVINRQEYNEKQTTTLVAVLHGKEEKEIDAAYRNYQQESKIEKQTPKPLIEVAPQLFGFNLVIFQKANTGVTVVRRDANKYAPGNFPTYNLVFTGQSYYTISENDKSRGAVGWKELFAIIEDSKSSSESFGMAYSQLDPEAQKEFIKYQPKGENQPLEMTILYYVCYHGRSEFLRHMLPLVPDIQERTTRNTALHAASFRGHFNTVAFLLYIGLTPKQNAANKFPYDIIGLKFAVREKSNLNKMWNTYKQRGLNGFKEEFKNFKIVEEKSEKESELTSTITTTNAESSYNFSALTIDDVCKMVEDENVSLEELKAAVTANQIRSKINEIGGKSKCTIFYITCKKGKFELVKFMMQQINQLKKSGPQEAFSGRGNTPLHVANWNGHTRIVAYLLFNGVPLECQTGGKKVKPNHHTERNINLDQETRSTLLTIYQLCEKRAKELPQFFEDSKLQIEEIKSEDPLPLWFYVGVPKDEPNPSYLSMSHLWYYKRQGNNQNPVLYLFDDSTTSILNGAYLKYRKTPSNPRFQVMVPIPPRNGFFGMFSSSDAWSYTAYDLDFERKEIRMNKETYDFVIASRPNTWFYSIPDQDAGYLPFPHKVNSLLNEASKTNPHLQFSFYKERGFFVRPTVTLVTFDTKVATMNNESKERKVLVEGEVNNRLFWEPDFYAGRFDDENMQSDLEILAVDDEEEEQKVKDYFYFSMPKNIVISSITKVLSPKLKEHCNRAYELASNVFSSDLKLKNAISYYKLLWYGKSDFDPRTINLQGLKQNHTSARNFGKGFYYSSEATFAANSAFTSRKGTKSIILTKVVTGLSLYCTENTSISSIPTNFNSIYTLKNGNWIYYLTDTYYAFPHYIVEFIEPK